MHTGLDKQLPQGQCNLVAHGFFCHHRSVGVMTANASMGLKQALMHLFVYLQALALQLDNMLDQVSRSLSVSSLTWKLRWNRPARGLSTRHLENLKLSSPCAQQMLYDAC